jgi:hypothetical protein
VNGGRCSDSGRSPKFSTAIDPRLPKSPSPQPFCVDDAGRPLHCTPLPSRTGDPILRHRLDEPTPVGEVAPHSLPHGAAYLLWQRCERLASGSPISFKRGRNRQSNDDSSSQSRIVHCKLRGYCTANERLPPPLRDGLGSTPLRRTATPHRSIPATLSAPCNWRPACHSTFGMRSSSLLKKSDCFEMCERKESGWYASRLNRSVQGGF